MEPCQFRCLTVRSVRKADILVIPTDGYFPPSANLQQRYHLSGFHHKLAARHRHVSGSTWGTPNPALNSVHKSQKNKSGT